MKRVEFAKVCGSLLLLLAAGVHFGRAQDAPAQAPVALTSPAGGETWSAGSQHYLTWKGDKLPAGATLKAVSSTDGGKTWAVIAEAAPNSGKYLWKVPDTV